MSICLNKYVELILLIEHFGLLDFLGVDHDSLENFRVSFTKINQQTS